MPKYKLDEDISGKVVKDALNSGIPRDAIKVHTFGGIEVEDKYHEKFEKIIEKYNGEKDDSNGNSSNNGGSNREVQQ